MGLGYGQNPRASPSLIAVEKNIQHSFITLQVFEPRQGQGFDLFVGISHCLLKIFPLRSDIPDIPASELSFEKAATEMLRDRPFQCQAEGAAEFLEQKVAAFCRFDFS